jgi:hypothetical protein
LVGPHLIPQKLASREQEKSYGVPKLEEFVSFALGHEKALYETAIVGGGAAGTGPLVWAAGKGLLTDWLDSGIVLIEQRRKLGGTVGRYAINADTSGSTFLEALEGPDCEPWLSALAADPITQELMGWRTGLPPLKLAGLFLEKIGAALAGEFTAHQASLLLTRARGSAVRLLKDGSLVVETAEGTSRRHSIRAATAVVALGGRQNTHWNSIEIAPGIHLGRWQGKIIPSKNLLTKGRAQCAGRWLSQWARSEPRAVILGGAHSAFAAASLLLNGLPNLRWRTGGLRILYRTEPRVFFPSRGAALAANYPFTEDDICPATGRVFRLSGLRGDGRELFCRIRGIGSIEPETRATAQSLLSLTREDLIEVLDTTDLIVAALGYRMATPPVFDAAGRMVRLAKTGPAVDHECRLLTATGQALPNVFGIGLGSNFQPWGAMAGERSFRGQQNSLWLYQHGLGEIIYNAVRCYARRLLDLEQPSADLVAA